MRLREIGTRSVLAAIAVTVVAVCPPVHAVSDPLSDAPDPHVVDPGQVRLPSSYEEALRRWRGAEDVNAWIGATFEYDMARAMLLSETQREHAGRPAIHDPTTFFGSPRGVCVDLSRFAVETLRAIDPQAKAAYLMIEFAPVSVGGSTLRRHWLASFERGGQRYFFADSKRPGFLAGPYGSAREFVEEYARYRGREVVAFRELESYERKTRALMTRRPRQERH